MVEVGSQIGLRVSEEAESPLAVPLPPGCHPRHPPPLLSPHTLPAVPGLRAVPLPPAILPLSSPRTPYLQCLERGRCRCHLPSSPSPLPAHPTCSAWKEGGAAATCHPPPLLSPHTEPTCSTRKRAVPLAPAICRSIRTEAWYAPAANCNCQTKRLRQTVDIIHIFQRCSSII